MLNYKKNSTPDYKNEKYIYHLTAIENIPEILEHGIRCRSILREIKNNFIDVADSSIIDKRDLYGLDEFVPFHWVYGSEFDYAVHEKQKDTEFVYIAIDRSVAKNENWKVIPQHPLAGNKAPEIHDYSIGFNKINWSYMQPHHQYYGKPYNYQYKSTTMAECIAPLSVPSSKFAKIFVASDEALSFILDHFEEPLSEDEDYFSSSEYSNENQLMNDYSYDSSSIIIDIPDDLFEVRPDMFKYYD